MTCKVTASPVWWPNGAVGREIRCETCSRVLWQSAPDVPYDASDELVATLAEEHQASLPKPKVHKAPLAETVIEPGPAERDH